MLMFVKLDNEPLLIKRFFSLRQAGEDTVCVKIPHHSAVV